MTYTEDIQRFERSVQELRAYSDKIATLNFLSTHNDITKKYGISWDQLMLFINITTKGTLTHQQADQMQNALRWGELEKYRIKVQWYCLRILIAISAFGFLGNLSIFTHFIRQIRTLNQNVSKMRSYFFLITFLALVDGLYCVFNVFGYYHEWQLSYQLGSFACYYAVPVLRTAMPYLVSGPYFA